MPGSYSLPSGRGPMGPVDEPTPPRPGATSRTGGMDTSPSGGGFGLGKTGGYAGPTYRGDGSKVSVGIGKNKSVGVGGKFKFAKGGKVSTASKRADGCAVKGKTKGRMV